MFHNKLRSYRSDRFKVCHFSISQLLDDGTHQLSITVLPFYLSAEDIWALDRNIIHQMKPSVDRYGKPRAINNYLLFPISIITMFELECWRASSSHVVRWLNVSRLPIQTEPTESVVYSLQTILKSHRAQECRRTGWLPTSAYASCTI